MKLEAEPALGWTLDVPIHAPNGCTSPDFSLAGTKHRAGLGTTSSPVLGGNAWLSRVSGGLVIVPSCRVSAQAGGVARGGEPINFYLLVAKGVRNSILIMSNSGISFPALSTP